MEFDKLIETKPCYFSAKLNPAGFELRLLFSQGLDELPSPHPPPPPRPHLLQENQESLTVDFLELVCGKYMLMTFASV